MKMKFKRMCVLALSGFCFAAATAHANKVLLTANQPTKITFKVAHKNKGNEIVYGEIKSVDVNKKALTIPVDLNGYDLAGIVIVSADGHTLPDTANQFDQPEQCSMTTNKNKSTGKLVFIMDAHTASCRTQGGVFG